MIKLLPDVTAEEIHLAYDARNRARELAAPMRGAYGAGLDIVLDEDALLMAFVELIRRLRDDGKPFGAGPK